MNKLKIAIYLRLSKDDGDKAESDSIFSQRSIIKMYINKNFENADIVGEYIDDGFTGTNFNRPQFIQMIEDIDKGNINCVIVKDLSRLGRDYIGVGQYLEKYFPLKDVRFIAVNDGYDTYELSGNDEFIMPIKNIFNAQYSKDISRKVKSSFRALQNEGKFVGAFASYGYKKDEKDKHKLIIDEPAAEVVRMIYSMYVSGIGKITIARKLNDMKIPCPSEYKRLNGLNYTNGAKINLTKYWTYSTVNSILKNEMYIGNMIQNKTIRKTVRGKAMKNSRENWTRVEHTHEAIIEISEWNNVQELLKRNTRQLDFEENVGLFAGYLFCGDCGRAMSKIKSPCKNNNTIIQYICGSYKRYGSNICTRHAVKVEVLQQLLIGKINEQLEKADKISINIERTQKVKNDYKAYEIALNRIYNIKKSLYEDYRNDIITIEEYRTYKDDYLREEEMIEGQIKALQQCDVQEEDVNLWIKKLEKYRKVDSLDREIIAEILDKIVVRETDKEISVEIIFKIELQ